MMNYPSLDRLKAIYPNVGVKILKPAFQSEGSISGNMTVNSQVYSEYKFVGNDYEELFYKILKAQHFIHQKTGVSVVTGEKTVADDAVTSTDDTVWVINDQLVERYRVKRCDVQSYVDRGFDAGRRNFATWVDKAKIAAWAEKSRQNNLDKLKQLAANQSVSVLTREDYRGARVMIDPADGKRKRILAADVQSKVADGWLFSDKSANRPKSVNAGAGRGAHFKGRKWVLNPNKRTEKLCLPKEQAEAKIAKGWIACGARTK